MGDDRGIAYREGDTTIYRASAVGGCIRALVAALTGYETNYYPSAHNILSLAADEGNLHEGAVIDRLRDMGYRVDEQQSQVEYRVVKGIVIRGHSDGIIYPPKARAPRILEVKTMSKVRYKNWKSFDTALDALRDPEFAKYGVQITVYMLAHGIEKVVYAVKNRDSGELDVQEFAAYPFSPKEIRRKILKAESAAMKDTLPDCDIPDSARFFCGYQDLHDVKDSEGPDDFEPITDVTAAALEAMAARHVELSVKVKAGREADSERRDVNARIKETLGGRLEATAGEYEVKMVKAGGKKPLNREKASRELMVATGMDLAAFEAVLEECREDPAEGPNRYPKVTRRGR
jgi:hypothetical protein